ncbi:MAG: hypothetical protein ACLFV2_11635 [Desulfurivibrionaceae bacterium]
MTQYLPEEAATLFKDFREMQDRHLTALAEKNLGSIPDSDDQRRRMLQRLKNWFESEEPATIDPSILKAELGTLMEKEEKLKREVENNYRKLRAELESIRIGKKALNHYSEKGYGLGDSPHFVSRTT